jgi:hypothetical protein
MSTCYLYNVSDTNRAQSTSKASITRGVIVLLVSVDTSRLHRLSLSERLTNTQCTNIILWLENTLLSLQVAHHLMLSQRPPSPTFYPPHDYVHLHKFTYPLLFFSSSSLFPFSLCSPQLIIHTHHIHNSKYTVQVITSPHTSTNLPINQQLCSSHQLHTHKQHQQ